ncbi:MAG: phosphatase PAP2 family protein [Chloroflexota bacterium]
MSREPDSLDLWDSKWEHRSMTKRTWALLILVLIVEWLYEPLNRPWGTVHHLGTVLDVATPLLPVFAIPYLLYIPFYLGTLIYFGCRPAGFRTLAISMIAVALVSYLFYFFFQTTVPRPPVQPNTYFAQLLLLIYHNDSPYNCFPSLHVANSTLCALTYLRFTRRAYLWSVPFSILVALSTIFVKQHVIADVIAGASLSVLVFIAVVRVSGRYGDSGSVG